MFRTDRSSAVVLLKQYLNEGKELVDFNIFEVNEAKLNADEWYNGLLFTLRENITNPDDVIKEMNDILNKEEKVIIPKVLRYDFTTAFTDEYTKAYNILQSKIKRVLEVFENYIKEIE